jgi:hypothetical protein
MTSKQEGIARMTAGASRSRRYLGIQLGGSRRTAVVCLDYFPRERKVFLAEKHLHLHGSSEETADELLLRVVNGLAPDIIAVDAPLSLPPCLKCQLHCPGAGACTVPAVRWMREEAQRRGWGKNRFPPPYTHRPVDLLLRGRWQDEVPLSLPVEEAFGSGRAPLAARMAFLRPRFEPQHFVEVSPRFALAGIASWYGISVRELRRARDLETGAENRFTILNRVATKPELAALPYVFLYISDVVALARELSAFDAFLCSLMALLEDLKLLQKPEFEPAWGQVARPVELSELQKHGKKDGA